MRAASPIRRAAGLLAGTVVALVIFFACGELLSRAFDLVDRLNHFPRRLFMASDDPRLPYRLRPGVATEVRGVPVRVNEHGLRGPSIDTAPPSGVRRILALGDSATFGQGLPVEQAFPSILQQELTARAGGHWEVVNAGVEGYNTAAELAYLERYGLALHPETVVVGFNLNDFDYAPVLGPLGVLTSDQRERMSPASPANWSEFYLVLRWLGRSLAARLRGDPHPLVLGRPDDAALAQLDRYASALRKAYYRQPTDTRWQVLEDSLRRLGEVTRTHGMPLVIAIIPDGDQVGVPDPDLTPQQKILAICARERLECLDLQPTFAAHAAEGPLFLNIMHPNAAGQRLIAGALADRLLAAGA